MKPPFRFALGVLTVLLVVVVPATSVPAAPLGSLAPPPAGPALPAFGPPPALAVDASLPRPFLVDMLGANATHAWLEGSTQERPARHYEMVLDLATGCVSESIANAPRLRALEMGKFVGAFDRSSASAAREQAWAEGQLADPLVQGEIRAHLGLASRFGRRALGQWAWSADGSDILALPAETAFRSRDGGQSYEKIDGHQARYPFVTRDGQWAFYERCADAAIHNAPCPDASRDVAIFATSSAAPPRLVPLGRGTIAGLDPTGRRLVVIHDDDAPGTVAAMHIDPETGAVTRAFAIPSRPLPKNKFFTIDPSPDGAFGTYNSVEHPMTTVKLVSMTDGRIARTMRGGESELGIVALDEEGRMAWWRYQDDRTRAATATGPVRDLGAGSPLGWAPGGRLLIYDVPSPPKNHPAGTSVPQPPGTLAGVACKMVRVAPVRR